MNKHLILTALCVLTLVTGCRTTQRAIDPYQPITTHPVTPPSLSENDGNTPSQSSSSQQGDKTATISKNLTPVVASEEQNFYNRMLETYGSWETLTVRGNVSVGNLSSSYEMRMIRNESIQISLRPILGIEIARLIVTCDSIYMYDKINHRYTVDALSDFSDKFPFKPTISDLQNAMLGRPFILGNSNLSAQDFDKLTITGDNNSWTMQPLIQPEGIQYHFTFVDTQLTSAYAIQESSNREANCKYEDVSNDTGYMLPEKITIKVKGSSKTFNFSTTYTSASWNNHVTIQHLSTTRYTRSSLSNVLKSLI